MRWAPRSKMQGQQPVRRQPNRTGNVGIWITNRVVAGSNSSLVTSQIVLRQCVKANHKALCRIHRQYFGMIMMGMSGRRAAMLCLHAVADMTKGRRILENGPRRLQPAGRENDKGKSD